MGGLVADHAGIAAEIRPRAIEVWTFDVGNEAACCALGDSSCGSGRVIASIRVRTELDCVWLSYGHRRSDEPWKDEAYSIHIVWTLCNCGGTRSWFRCPVRGCGRRVAILYENRIFACRQCHQLVYESQRTPAHDRALRKAQAIRVKLGGSGSMADSFPAKPKGMHYQTYERLSMEAEAADRRSWPPSLLRLFRR